MKNQFIEKPTADDIMEIGRHFLLRDAVIVIDYNDIRDVLEGAENAVVLTGKASGSNRCADAIEDAVLHTCSVADGYNFFSANKCLLYIYCPKDSPMLMSENEAINTFFDMFHNDIMLKWGLSEKENTHEMVITIIASNLHKSKM